MFNSTNVENVAVFVDASNLWYMTQSPNVQPLHVDFIRLRDYFNQKRYRLAYIGYFTAIDENNNPELKTLLDILACNGYTVVSKPAMVYDNRDGSRKVKGNTDIELTIAALRIHRQVDRVVLVSGDGDYEPLVNEIKNNGVPVTVLAAQNSRMMSGKLRKCASSIIDLADIYPSVCKL